MMKRFLFAALLFSALFVCGIRASAVSSLSPALSLIAEQKEMVVAGLVAGEIRFSEDDFLKL